MPTQRIETIEIVINDKTIISKSNGKITIDANYLVQNPESNIFKQLQSLLHILDQTLSAEYRIEH